MVLLYDSRVVCQSLEDGIGRHVRWCQPLADLAAIEVHGLELMRRRGVGGHAWRRCPRTVGGVPRYTPQYGPRRKPQKRYIRGYEVSRFGLGSRDT